MKEIKAWRCWIFVICSAGKRIFQMVDSFPTNFLPEGLATGIGSLPFADPEAALELIFAELPDMPHWPQLPRRSEREHFVHQFLQPLLDCGMLEAEGKRWILDASGENSAACLTEFYTGCLPAEAGDGECRRAYLPTPEAAAGLHAFLARARTGGLKQAGYVKGQIAGPLSVALELKDRQGRPAYYHGDLRDTIVRTLALNARCQASALSGFGAVPIVFVDDPAVGAYGSRLHLALSREMIIEDLNFIFEAIDSENALAGIHCCEAVDWSLVLETRAQILSLDAYRFGASLIPYATHLRRFVEKGGVIAWGIVPTLDDPFGESVQSLQKRLDALWNDLFPTHTFRETVLRQSMVTPACGTGLLTEERARRIYRLTAELSRTLRGHPD
jgi:hypothetical protein